MMLIWFIGLVVCLVAFSSIQRWQRKRSLRAQGVYPQPGQASMPDVERLVNGGYHIEAVMCYREVFPQEGLVEARDAVNALKSK